MKGKIKTKLSWPLTYLTCMQQTDTVTISPSSRLFWICYLSQMFDLRKEKTIDLKGAKYLKEDTTYLYKDPVTGKNLIAKFFNLYDDHQDEFLIAEFKKIALLSSEPEIATVYFLATGDFGKGSKSCYVMDYIEGKSLGTIINENKHLSPAFVTDTIRQIANGIEKAHHSEISHGDLHEENVMINQYGYVKLIDFIWYDYKFPFEKNQPEDIAAFKKLVDMLMAKVKDEDKQQVEIYFNYLKGIKSFTGVTRNLSILSEVADDLALMDEDSKQILAHMIYSITPEANLQYILEDKNVKIPEKYVPEFTKEHQALIDSEKKSKFGLSYSDSRAKELHRTLQPVFNKKLHQLRQAGFITWDWGIQNTGEKFVGPYELHIRIFFTSKIFKWQRLNMEFNFLPEVKGSLPRLILD